MLLKKIPFVELSKICGKNSHSFSSNFGWNPLFTDINGFFHHWKTVTPSTPRLLRVNPKNPLNPKRFMVAPGSDHQPMTNKSVPVLAQPLKESKKVSRILPKRNWNSWRNYKKLKIFLYYPKSLNLQSVMMWHQTLLWNFMKKENRQ